VTAETCLHPSLVFLH